MSTTIPRRKALLVLSAGRNLPLVEPANHEPLSIGVFLVELAAVLAKFQDTHDFVLATPDGRAPQLDINGLALNFHAAGNLGPATARHALQVGARRFSPEQLRAKNPGLVTRRSAELALARRHLGRLSVSEVLPMTDREAASIRDEVIADFNRMPERPYHSLAQLIGMHRDPADDFSLAEFDFAYMPGGHAPMIDFNDNPWMGELLHSLRENDVPISMICHAPVALTSARYRVGVGGAITINEHHRFRGAHITTVPKHGEKMMLAVQYPHVPGARTRLPYYVDIALKDAGYNVDLSLNPSAVKVIWDADHQLLTGNGPQAVDAQADRLAEILRTRSTTPATTRTPAA